MKIRPLIQRKVLAGTRGFVLLLFFRNLAHMPRDPRSEVLDPHQVEAVHLYNRTIDGLYLLGKNPDTGEDFSYRQGWLVDKMNQLFAHLCVELLSYGVLSNHYHINVRTRPDIAAALTDRQVAERWLNSLSGRPDKDGNFKPPSENAIEMLMANKEKLETCRTQLSDCSHLMKQLNQYMAQRANYEDGRRGSFWGGRYGSTRLVDDEALLACTVYIDLNRIRAWLDKPFKQHDSTALGHRITELLREQYAEDQAQREALARRHQFDLQEKGAHRCRALSKLEIDEANDPVGSAPSRSGRRCSDKGFLPISFERYLELLKWTLGMNQDGDIELPAALRFSKLPAKVWLSMTNRFGELFGSIAGSLDSMAEERKHVSGDAYFIRKQARVVLQI